MTKLDELAVNIEIVLISLIQGVALVVLGEQSFRALDEPDWYRYIAFVLSGLVILLLFWGQSVMHALSFIRWPIRLEHMLLYFAAGFLQILAYAHITDLDGWFFYWTLFSVAAVALYFVDLSIVRDSFKNFAKLKGGEKFIDMIEDRHLYEMRYILPAAIGLNLILLGLVWLFPKVFQNWMVYETTGALQLAFSLYALYEVRRTFSARSAMIGALFSVEK